MVRISFSASVWIVIGKRKFVCTVSEDCAPADDVTGDCLLGLLVAFRVQATY